MKPGIAVYCSGLTVASPHDIAKMVGAADIQLGEHFCPAYSRNPIAVTFFEDPSKIPTGMPTVLVSDICDDADALAYHTEQSDGRITGLTGAKTVLDAGGSLFAGELSVSTALSHELLETAFDPYVNKYFVMPASSKLMAGEVCDPVQDQCYEVEFGSEKIAVSNFVLPAYWDDSPAPGSKFDYLGSLERSFTKTKGGYFVFESGGAQHQQGMRASWKPQHPSLSRTAQRMNKFA